MAGQSHRAKGDVQLTPEWRAADELAKAMFEQRFPDGKWRGRATNRAYWRRLAKGELHRCAKATGEGV